MNCPNLCGQYKKGFLKKNLKFKQQTDFVFKAESVLFLFVYIDDCRSGYTQLWELQLCSDFLFFLSFSNRNQNKIYILPWHIFLWS